MKIDSVPSKSKRTLDCHECIGPLQSQWQNINEVGPKLIEKDGASDNKDK